MFPLESTLLELRQAKMVLSDVMEVLDKRGIEFDREIPHSYFPFGVLEVTDLPRLLGASGVKTILIEPIDGDWQPLSPSAVPEELRSRLTTMEEHLGSNW